LVMINRRNFLVGGLACFTYLDEASSAQLDLQRLVDETPAGGTLVLESRRYKLENTLMLKMPINILGNGAVLFGSSCLAPLIKVLSSDVFLTDFDVLGSGVFLNCKRSMRHTDAIQLGNGSRTLKNIKLKNIVSKNVGDTAIAVEGNKSKGYWGGDGFDIENCGFLGAGTQDNYHAGIYIRNVRNISISGCDISGFGQGILTTGRTTNLKIESNNIVEPSKQHAVYLSGATEAASVLNNRFSDLAGTGVKCSAPHTTISGNDILRPRVWGINLKADLDSVEVSDNFISGCGDDAIDSGFERSQRIQSNLSLLRNTIVRTDGSGINFAYDADNCEYHNILMADNQIIGTGGSAIRFVNNKVAGSRTTKLVIRGNELRNNKKTPISLGRLTGAVAVNVKLSYVSVLSNRISCSNHSSSLVEIADAEYVSVVSNILQATDCTDSNIRVVRSHDVVIAENLCNHKKNC